MIPLWRYDSRTKFTEIPNARVHETAHAPAGPEPEHLIYHSEEDLLYVSSRHWETIRVHDPVDLSLESELQVGTGIRALEPGPMGVLIIEQQGSDQGLRLRDTSTGQPIDSGPVGGVYYSGRYDPSAEIAESAP